MQEFIEEIKSVEEKINLSLFEDFFGFLSPADYAKELLNTSPDKNKKNCSRVKRHNIRFKRQNRTNEWQRKKI